MLGARIAALRRASGMRQAELARRLQVSSSAVGMYEQGRREPSGDTLVDIARIFGVSTDYLLTGGQGAEALPRSAAGLTKMPSMEYDNSREARKMDDFSFMDAALELAREAFVEGEVPVGCVVVRRGQIVGRGRNRRETGRSALAHAEVEAIGEACANLGGWRLWECTLYVTLEPCPMCAGAILNARIPRVVYGAKDPKAGACGGVCDLFAMPFNHHPEMVSGIREEECAGLLTDFFRDLRVELRSRPKWKRPPENRP